MKFSILNLLSFVTIAALAIALVSLLVAKDPVLMVKSTNDSFSWDLRQRLLIASPDWPKSEKNPPLSVRDAIKMADEITGNLEVASKPLQIGSWTFESLVISPLDISYGDTRSKWCYVAHFTGARLPMHVGHPERVSVMILMDGTVYVGEGAWSNGELEHAVRKMYPGDGG